MGLLGLYGWKESRSFYKIRRTYDQLLTFIKCTLWKWLCFLQGLRGVRLDDIIWVLLFCLSCSLPTSSIHSAELFSSKKVKLLSNFSSSQLSVFSVSHIVAPLFHFARWRSFSPWYASLLGEKRMYISTRLASTPFPKSGYWLDLVSKVSVPSRLLGMFSLLHLDKPVVLFTSWISISSYLSQKCWLFGRDLMRFRLSLYMWVFLKYLLKDVMLGGSASPSLVSLLFRPDHGCSGYSQIWIHAFWSVGRR